MKFSLQDRFPSEDGESTKMDKDNELLDVLPDDLPINEDELFGLMAGLKSGPGKLC